MSRRFGCEFEFALDSVSREEFKNYFASSIHSNHPNQKLLEFETPRAWSFKPEHCGVELTTPVLEATQSNLEIVKNVLNGVRDQVRGRRTINRSCGLHVHIDVADLSNHEIKNMLLIFYNFERVILKLQPRSRTGNQYCQAFNDNIGWISSYDPDSSSRNNSGVGFLMAHSNGISLQDLDYWGAIEVRYGAGTISGSKAYGWIRMLLILIEIAKNYRGQLTPRRIDSVEELVSFIQTNLTSCEWLENQKARCCGWISRRASAIAGSIVDYAERRTRRSLGNPAAEIEAVAEQAVCDVGGDEEETADEE